MAKATSFLVLNGTTERRGLPEHMRDGILSMRILCTPPPCSQWRWPRAAPAAPTRSLGYAPAPAPKLPRTDRTANTAPRVGAVAASEQRSRPADFLAWPHIPSPPGIACPGATEETASNIANSHSGSASCPPPGGSLLSRSSIGRTLVSRLARAARLQGICT